MANLNFWTTQFELLPNRFYNFEIYVFFLLFVPFDHVIKEHVIKEETKKHNPNWPKTPDHQCRILIVEGSVSGKTKCVV